METLYNRLIDLNGTGKNAALRRLSAEELKALEAYAATQPNLPHSNVNLIESAARREMRRR